MTDHAVLSTPEVGFIVIYDEQQFVSEAVYIVWILSVPYLRASLLVNTGRYLYLVGQRVV